MSVSEMYDTVSSRYEIIVKATKYSGPEYLRNELNISAPELIIDLGCATGLLGETLKATYPGSTLIGYDISPRMIKLAKSKNVYDQLFVQDLNTPLTSIKSDSVDLVIGFGFFEFLDKPNDLLLELNRVLLPGARSLLSFQEYWPNNPELAPRSTHSGDVIHHAYSMSEILNLQLESGFLVKKIESITGYVSTSGFECPYVFVDAVRANE